MKLFLYYSIHSLKNQIKKLCRTWFIIFLLVCVVLGGIVGTGVGIAVDIFGGGDEPSDVIPEEPGYSEDENIEEEIELSAEELARFSRYAVGALFFLFMFLAAFSADKSGSSIFLMADVNLLFPAPMKPQSVLLFKLMNQILIGIFASIYLLFQIPTLNVIGFNALSVILMFFVWIMLFTYQKLLNVLLYTLSSTHSKVKKLLRPVSLGVIIAVLALFFLFYAKEQNAISSLDLFFAGKATYFIPVYGWFLGAVSSAVIGNIGAAVIYSLLLLVGAAILAFAVWHIKADFYEEAMQRSQETAAVLEAAKSNTVVKSKKERPDRIKRDEMKHGSGASVFFHKAMYNRFRFAHLKIFTKTSEFYLVVLVGIAVITRLAAQSNSFIPAGIALAALAFFRSLGNPLAADMSMNCFVTVPASAHEKVFYSLLSGTVSAILDMLPAVIISALIVGASPITVIAFMLLAVCVDFYSANVMLFIEFSLPTSLALAAKQSISIMFIYFGIAPIAAVAIIGAVLGLFEPFLFIASLVAFAIGAIFFAFSPMFIAKGRK